MVLMEAETKNLADIERRDSSSLVRWASGCFVVATDVPMKKKIAIMAVRCTVEVPPDGEINIIARDFEILCEDGG